MALGIVQHWLTHPSDDEWTLIFGARALRTPLPEQCAFLGGLPGELIEIEVLWPTPRPGRRRSRRAPEPRICAVAVLEASPERVMPRCPVFGECGGCQLQHLDYEHQLIWKTQRVADLLRGAGLVAVPIEPTLGCAEPWQYRNQMRFSVDRAGQPGLTAQGTHRVLPLRTCPIAHPLINRALGVLSASPCARPQLLVRCGAATGHVLIQPAPDVAQLERLTATGLDIHTETLNDALCVAIDPVGQDGGHEQHAEFRIRPSSFFQTNTAQANRMVTAVLAGLPSGPGVTLVDAYCGVGTFAALLAPHADTVLAIEESASAVRDAQWNLRHYPNVQVLQAKTELILPQLSQALDGLVIDPPRAGCQRPVLDSLRTRKVSRVVYVSCNPETLVRDLAYLCLEDVYRIRLVQPLDMFPQTAHIETIVTLEAT